MRRYLKIIYIPYALFFVGIVLSVLFPRFTEDHELALGCIFAIIGAWSIYASSPPDQQRK